MFNDLSPFLNVLFHTQSTQSIFSGVPLDPCTAAMIGL